MSKKCAVNPRLGAVGGQAVMEGVMMNSKQGLAIAVRNTDGDIVVRQKQRHTLREKYKICRVPVIRGIVGFAETLVMSFRTLTESTEMLGVEMEAESKFEKWLDKKFGKSIMAVASLIGTVLGVALALLLFIWLPALLVRGIEKYIVPRLDEECHRGTCQDRHLCRIYCAGVAHAGDKTRFHVPRRGAQDDFLL